MELTGQQDGGGLGQWEGERERESWRVAALSDFLSKSCVGYRRPGRFSRTGRLCVQRRNPQGREEPPAQFTSVDEEQDVERVTVARNDVCKDTMSAMMKLATKICEFCDVNQPTAESQLMTPPERRLVTRGVLRPAQDGAEDTEERVCGMVPLMTSFGDDKLWRAMLSCLSLDQS